MKVFLSWHGPRSRAVAEALNDWLKRVIQAVKPFFSPEIEKGAKWSSEIDGALEGTRFGIVCLTPDNLDSPWIHYEAGALSKTKDALIWTFLHGLAQGDVPQPLGRFQHTLAQKGDTLRLLKTINGRLADVGGEPLSEQLLEENFELFWPQLEKRLQAVEKIPLKSTTNKLPEGDRPRAERAILDEILELVRSQERRLIDPRQGRSSSRRSTLKEKEEVKGVEILFHSKSDESVKKTLDRLKSVIYELAPVSDFIETVLPNNKGHVVVDFTNPVEREFLEFIIVESMPSATAPTLKYIQSSV